MRRIVCALLGALSTAALAQTPAETPDWPSLPPVAPPPLVTPRSSVAPQPAAPAFPTAAVVAKPDPAETTPVQSVYFVVATRVDRSGLLDSTTRGVAFAFEKDDTDCVLVTASHVVQGASQINVYQFTPELSPGVGYEARLKWLDTAKDLAALRIRRNAACSPVRRQDGDISIGHRVTAFLSTPLSRGMITSGTVAAHWSTDVGPTIVCDMAIYPGHSGSPLLDREGRSVGMVLSRTQSLEMSAGFALPIGVIQAVFVERASAAAKQRPPGVQQTNPDPVLPLAPFDP